MSLHVIHFLAPITDQSCANLMGICIQARQQGASKIQLRMASRGGGTTPGFALCNFLKTFPVPVTTHNLSSVESMAVPIYLSATTRTAEPNTRFVIHSMAWDIAQPGNIPLATLRGFIAMLDDDADRYIRVFEEATQGADKPLNIRKILVGEGATIIDVAAATVASIVSSPIASDPLPDDAALWWIGP